MDIGIIMICACVLFYLGISLFIIEIILKKVKSNIKNKKTVIKVAEICSLISVCVALVICCAGEYADNKAKKAITGENIDGYNISSDILGYNTKICGDEISYIRINGVSVVPSGINVCGRIQCNVKNYDKLESCEDETNRFDDYETGSSKQDAANSVAEAAIDLYYLTDVAGGEDVILLYTAKVSFSGDLVSFEIIDVE